VTFTAVVATLRWRRDPVIAAPGWIAQGAGSQAVFMSVIAVRLLNTQRPS